MTTHWFSEQEARDAKVQNSWDGMIKLPRRPARQAGRIGGPQNGQHQGETRRSGRQGERVGDDHSVLERYARDESFATPMPPSCVVKALAADQVEKIVGARQETKTTLVPVSSSGPHHKGDTVPSVPGSVIVDMSGMKRILNVNRQQRMAVRRARRDLW